jgi:hypothetical protein
MFFVAYPAAGAVVPALGFEPAAYRFTGAVVGSSRGKFTGEQGTIGAADALDAADLVVGLTLDAVPPFKYVIGAFRVGI